MEDKELEHMIIMLVINQQPYYREFVSDLTKQRNELLEKENEALHPAINEQYIDQAKKVIVDEITKQISCAAEPVYEVLNNISNFEEYINL